MANNSTFLTIIKWLVLASLIMYIWRALREGHSPSLSNGTIEGYDDTGKPGTFTQFDTPIKHKLEPVDSVDSVNSQCQECTPASRSVSGGKLLPVMDPCFNMREVCKQCILLEDHLNSKGKDCMDCCQKHFLTIEALCEEAVGLDKESKYPEIRDLPSKIRSLIRDFIKRRDLHEIAQDVRVIRKQCMKKYFDAF